MRHNEDNCHVFIICSVDIFRKSYHFREVVGRETYLLESLDRDRIPRIVNLTNLYFYFNLLCTFFFFLFFIFCFFSQQ